MVHFMYQKSRLDMRFTRSLVVRKRRRSTDLQIGPTLKRLKVPSSFPKFSKNAIMFAMYGSPAHLLKIMNKFRRDQHMFFSSKSFKFTIMQGEFSEKGDPHIQGVVQATRKGLITTSQIYKALEPEAMDKLSVCACKSISDATHYCSKPHDNCNCKNCEKARGCRSNWHVALQSGEPPKGQGCGRFDEFIECMKVNPTRGNMIENFGNLVIRYPSGMKIIQQYHNEQKVYKDSLAPDVPELFQWERDLDIMLYIWDPRDRKCIVWIWSEKLKTGKTIGMKHVKHFYGQKKCKKGGKSLKHFLYSYEDQSLVHFNYTKRKPFTQEDLDMLEELSDGGIMNPDHYDCPVRSVNAHIFVTSNCPPPEEWRGERGRLRREICLDVVEKRQIYLPQKCVIRAESDLEMKTRIQKRMMENRSCRNPFSRHL